MGDIVTQRNIGAMVAAKRIADHATSTAAGTGDATTVTGLSIDRQGFGNGSMPLSVDVTVDFEATLASGATLSVGYAMQDSADNSTWADYQTATYAVAATGASGGSTVKSAFNVPVNLSSARRYVRFNYNPDLSAGSVDTSYSDCAAVFAGFDRLPATG